MAAKTLFCLSLLVYKCISVTVTIDVNNKIINTTDERYVSFTIDTSQLTHTNPAQDFALNNSQVIYLASQLRPSILRVGGTQGDYTYYEVGNENPCKLPSQGGYHCYTMQQFKDLVTFAKNVDASLVFGLSLGYPTYPTKNSKEWNYTNTQQFIQYIHNTLKYDNSDIYGFELGNEVSNGDPFTEPTFQANALKKLDSIIKDIYGKNEFVLFGPDQHSPALRESYDAGFGYIPEYVSDTCEILTGLTYHCYINQNATQLLTPNGLNEQYRESSRVSNIFNNKSLCGSNTDGFNRVKSHVIAGEIAEHNQGGLSGVSNTYYDGIWYLDALGTLASLGHFAFFRQTFAISEYGLLNAGYHPNCDYFNAYLFNNIMSSKVISIKSNNDNFRIYSHCVNKNINGISIIKNGVGMVYINLEKNSVSLNYDTNVLGNDVYLYALTPNDTNAGLQSKSMNLNGKTIKLNNDGKLPELIGKKVSSNDINIPSQSYGFIVFTDTMIDVCS